MSSVEDLAFAPTFHHMYGAQLLASIINTFLYGTSLIITLQYFRRFGRNDPLALKGTVALLICSATVETTASAHQTYDSFITKFGRQELLNEIVPSVTIEFLFVPSSHNASLQRGYGKVCFMANTYVEAADTVEVGKHFGFKFQWLTIPVIALAFLQLGAGIAQVSLMIKSKLYSTLDQHTATLVKVTTMQGVAAAICDILITVVLCWAFHSHRSGTRRTNSLVDKLIIYAINRGSATSICALLNVLLYYFASGTFYFLIPLQATTHFYVISAVTVLTSREGLRQEMDNSFHLSDLIVSNRSEAQTATSSQHDQRMTKEKEGPRDV
ncbi:hypothetical protein CC2G_004392 [Coprinopsis cinerea AmutBmut pab1-1]|nr:hypothetical protein CC2G_004392 [Coprinopsis cinerea AmutBmut pab1-1]